MKLSFDKFERYEMSQVTLCNPNSRVTEVDGKITITDTVGVLSNPKGMNLKLNFNAPHELSFDYYRHKSGDPIKQSFYDNIYEAIQTDRYIYLTDIGYFIISSVTDSDEDNIDKKSITCKSCEENELATAEGLYLEEGTYYLHTENKDGLLDLFLPKTAGWTIGFIDPFLLTKPYYVEDVEVDNGYNFLYTTVQDMFECIVEPNIIKRTISIYSRVYYAENHLTDIHIAKYNLLKYKTVEENDEDKYTALNVQGKDENLEIRAVNPTGKNVIYNFEPRYSWMSPTLQQAIEKWQEKCESIEDEYLTLQQGYYTEQELVFNKQKDIEVLELGLKQLESTRDFITSGAADNYLENIKLYCTQYNSNVNGNVDYAKRPFISPEEMISAGYPEFSNPDEEVATTYDCDYAFMNGSGSVLYTIKMTPIIEDRTVLSVEGLDAYYDEMASSCSSKEQLLAYDAAHSKLIINIANGDTPRDNEGLTALDKTLMPIKNNHWATVKAFMKAAGLDMTNLSNLLNEIENRQTALSHVNSAITIKQSEINKATLDYNAHKSVVYANYEEPISQINKDCALDITAIDINGNSIFTTDLLNELMTHIKPTDYVDEYMLVTESMTYPQKFEKAKELMDRAQSQLVKISSGQKTYSIDTRSFLFNKQFKHFSEQLCAGAIIYVETKSDAMEQLHLTGIDINFDEKSTDFTLGNKYNRSDLKALYEDALGQNSKSFSELKYIASIIEDQQKQLDYQRNWVADLRTLTLDNVLASEDQAIEINNRGLIGRKRQLNEDGSWKFDENGNPYFEDEQVKLIYNALIFTRNNWETAEAAIGKIAVGYNPDGSVKYSYGMNGRVIIGELFLGNSLVLTGTGAGIKINNNNGDSVFYADDDGNLILSGTIFAKNGQIGGWNINNSRLEYKVDDLWTFLHPSGLENVYCMDDVFRTLTIGVGTSGAIQFGVTNTGELYASGGQIGGWKIDQNGLSKTSTDPNGRPFYFYLQSNPYSAEHGEPYNPVIAVQYNNDYKFYVRSNGHLYAEDAEIEGIITATGGKIGEFNLSDFLSYANDTGFIRLGWNEYWAMAIAPGSIDDFSIGMGKDRDAYFAVAYDGKMVARNVDITGTINAHTGSIGGWTISGNTLMTGNISSETEVIIDPNYLIAHGDGVYWWDVVMCTQNYISQWSSESDINVKNTILEYDLKYETLFDALKPCRYKYNHGTSDRFHTGFIAQEVVEAIERADLTTQDFAGVIHLKEPNKNNCEWLLRRDEFVALNTWQIQKAKARIADLENIVAELKTQIQTLTAG